MENYKQALWGLFLFKTFIDCSCLYANPYTHNVNGIDKLIING